MKFGVIGSGSWGTAVANILADNNYKVFIWGRDRETITFINEQHENNRYLKGYKLNNFIKGSSDIYEVAKNSDVIVNAIPTQSIREVFKNIIPLLNGKIIINTAKGIEKETLKFIDEIFVELNVNKDNLAFLSGPTFAEEVIQRLPTACTISSYNAKLAENLQKLFTNKYFRVYRETDVKGVLLGGAVKNIIAIGCGIVDSLGLGNNARASLITRGLAEIVRFGLKLGCHPQTFSGLTGLGDLILTCTGNLSRNRKVGLELGKGKKLNEIIDKLGMVAEGVDTCDSVYNLSNKLKV
jgi:glycerol-3-phosphate dehydrogenase (NAD(P)+)